MPRRRARRRRSETPGPPLAPNRFAPASPIRLCECRATHVQERMHFARTLIGQASTRCRPPPVRLRTDRIGDSTRGFLACALRVDPLPVRSPSSSCWGSVSPSARAQPTRRWKCNAAQARRAVAAEIGRGMISARRLGVARRYPRGGVRRGRDPDCRATMMMVITIRGGRVLPMRRMILSRATTKKSSGIRHPRWVAPASMDAATRSSFGPKAPGVEATHYSGSRVEGVRRKSPLRDRRSRPGDHRPQHLRLPIVHLGHGVKRRRRKRPAPDASTGRTARSCTNRRRVIA